MKDCNCSHFDSEYIDNEEYTGFCDNCAGLDWEIYTSEEIYTPENKNHKKSSLLNVITNTSTLVLDSLLTLSLALLYPVRWLLVTFIVPLFFILGFLVIFIEHPIQSIIEKAKGEKMSYYYLSPLHERIFDIGETVKDKLLGD